MAFVNGDKSRFINFGLEGLNILDNITANFIKQLPLDVEKNFPRIVKKPYWCGFTNNEVSFDELFKMSSLTNFTTSGV
jgi:hypothetical protein